MSLREWLDAQEDRCEHGFVVAVQGCPACGQRLKFKGQAATTAAHPGDRAAVEAAIRALAATGEPFSANDARKIHGCRGGVVGATFTAMKVAGVIKPAPVADPLVRSTSGPTHGHHIFQWIGAAA